MARGWIGSAVRRTPDSHPVAWRATRGELADVVGCLLRITAPPVTRGALYISERDGVFAWVPPRSHVEPCGTMVDVWGCPCLAFGCDVVARCPQRQPLAVCGSCGWRPPLLWVMWPECGSCQRGRKPVTLATLRERDAQRRALRNTEAA